MARQRTGARAGGAIIALAILIGAFAGIFVGEASAGFLVGAAAGVAAAAALWLRDRRG